MGWVNGSNIKPVGDYLLRLLADKGSVRYGEEFYDFSEAQEQRLRQALGIGPDEDYEDDQHYPPIYADFAAGQFSRKGLVQLENLPETLPDGDPDYKISLTKQGRAFVSAGCAFPYWDMDL